MAFPSVGNTNTSVVSTAGTSHTVSLPANIVSGNLLLVLFGFSTVLNTNTWPADWNQFFYVEQSAGGTETGSGAWRKATGGEGATITVTTSVSGKSSHNAYRIIDAEDPTVQAPEVATAIGTNANANPPNETPTGGAKDYLWLAAGFNFGTTNYTGYPTNYTGGITVATTGGGQSSNTKTGSATRQLNASAEDPGAFVGGDEGGTSEWVGATIAIHPAGAPPAGQPIMARHQALPHVALPTPRLFFIPKPRLLRLPMRVLIPVLKLR